MTTTTTTKMVITNTTRRSMQTKSRCSRNSNGVLLFATMLILAIFSFSANTNTLFVSANTCTYKKDYFLVKKSRKKKKDIDMCKWLAEGTIARTVNMCNEMKVVRKKNGKRKKMYKKIKVVQKKNGKRKEMSYWKACRCTCLSAYREEANESNFPSSAPSESPNGFSGGNTDPGVCPNKYIETPTPTENPEPNTLYAFSECSSTYEDELTCYYQYTWDGCTAKTSQCRPVVSCTCNELGSLYPNKWTCRTETRESCPTPSPTQAPRRTPRPTQVPIERKNKSLLRTLREDTVVRNKNKNHPDTTGSEEEEHLRRDLTEESASDKNGEACPSPSPA